jgi:hypothetical protein
MTRDDIIRMAVECQLAVPETRGGIYIEALERFAELAAAAEREQCVDVAMKLMEDKTGEHPEYYRGIVVAAAHILTKEHL